MNIYHSLNELIDYIEENLDQNLDIKRMSQIVGVNFQTLQSVFSLLTNISLSEYIRLRRLSIAVIDLQNGASVMEVAIKYQYNSAVAFSRAFTKYHCIKPSDIKKNKAKGKNYPILHFDEDDSSLLDLSYRIEMKEAFSLYGVKKVTNENNISKDAPAFFKKVKQKYSPLYGSIPYAMVWYEKRFLSPNLEYWCLYKEPHEDFLQFDFPSSKWLIFSKNSTNSRDIQNLSYKFYTSFYEKNKYKLRDLPELEVYFENGTMEFWLPIV